MKIFFTKRDEERFTRKIKDEFRIELRNELAEAHEDNLKRRFSYGVVQGENNARQETRQIFLEALRKNFLNKNNEIVAQVLIAMEANGRT